MRTGLRERVRWFVPALVAVVALGAPGVVAADGNVAPSVTATVSNANPVEPQTVVASAMFTDPESDVETFTCSIDYGDGGLFATGVVSGTTCTGPAHRYLVTGSYVVMVFVTDSGGAGGVGMTSVNYTNVAPTLSGVALIGGSPQFGGPVSYETSISDPGAGAEGYDCSVDFGDGTGPQPGTYQPDGGMNGLPRCVSQDHYYPAVGDYTVTITVRDSGSAVATATASVPIVHPGPIVYPPADQTVHSTSGRWHVDETASFVDYNGPGAGPWYWMVDWGDGTKGGEVVASPGSFNLVHDYITAGSYFVKVGVSNSPGQLFSTGFHLTLIQDGPIVTAPTGMAVVTEGIPGAFSWMVVDPAPNYPYAIHVDWGDGSATDLTGQTSQYFSPNHTYAASDPNPYRGTTIYTATMTVTDAIGASGSASQQVGVVDVPPVVTAPPVSVPEGFAGQITLASFTDASVAPWQVAIYSAPPGFQLRESLQTPGPIEIPYSSSIGNTTFTVYVADRGGLISTVSVSVTVVNVSPVVGPVHIDGGVANGQPLKGQSVVGSASFTDPGSGGESYSCTIDYGDGSGAQTGTVSNGSCTGPAHVYSDLGPYAVSVSVRDSNGGVGTATVQVTVQSAVPVVTEVHFTPSPNIEGSPVAIVATFTAVGLTATPPETFSCFIDFGDPSGTAEGTVSGNQCFGPYHLYMGLGPHTATVSVVGSHGAGTASISLTAQNVPPVVGPVSLPDAFEVGVPIAASAKFGDPGSGIVAETYTCTVDYGDGGGAQPGAIDGPTCSGPSHTYGQNGDYNVTVRVTDSNGGVGTSAIAIGLWGIGPSITGLIFDPSPSLDGSPVRLIATFTDPGMGANPPETYACYVYYGDSTGAQEGSVVGNECLGPAHVFAGLGPYPVEVFVFDSNGGGDWATIDITLLNIAPIVTPYSVVSFGQSGIDQPYSVIFTDPGSAPGAPLETYTCAIDYGDGAGPQPGVIAGSICTGPSHTYATKGTYTFFAVVIDSNGGVGSYSLPIEIYNPVPIVGPVSAPASAMVGTAVTASAAYVSTGLLPDDTCTVDYGDGTGPLAGTTDGAICTGPSHNYASVGTFTITVTILSEIGSTGSSSATIQVNSLQVGSVSVSGTLTEGSSVAASAIFTPTGRQTYKCKVDYGDGTGAQTGTISGTTCKGPSHKYGRPGSFTITVNVTGSKGNIGSSTRTVDIANVMPVVTATLPTTAKVGTSVTLSASFTDPGTTETYQVVVDWGDGTRIPIQLGCGRSFTASHTYTRAGGYRVVVEVSDDQMAHVATAATGIAVYDPARTLSGSGTFASPAGACTFSSKCAGASTATFSVAASYARGATKPTATFTFSAAGISFTATSFEWYMVTEGVGVLYGSGKLNGLSGYRFTASAVDGTPDSIAVSIVDSTGNGIYHSTYTPLKTGGIVIR